MCSECLANLRRNAHKLRVPRGRSLLLEPRPTAAGLERHARRFGPAQVPETAAQYGLTVAVERERAVRRGGPTLRQRVAEYVRDGHSAEVIAELEDLSPGRARRLVEEVS